MIKKAQEILTKNLKWIIVFICAISFLAILEDVFEQEKLFIDTFIYRIVVLSWRIEPLTTVFKFITQLGGTYVLIGISILSLIFLNNKKVAISIPINLGIVALLNWVLKYIIARPRPEGYRLIDESGYSFPSGHSMVSMAFYGLLIYLIWKNCSHEKLKYISCFFLSLLIPLIGLSRIYLGVHYASDVIGGFVISLVYLIVFTTITQSIFELKQYHKGKKESKPKEEVNKQEKQEKEANE